MKRAILLILIIAGAAMAELRVYYWSSPCAGMRITKTGNPAHQANMEAQIELYAVHEDPNDPNSPVVMTLNTNDPNDPNDDVWYTNVSQTLDPTKSIDPNEVN